MYWVCVTSRGRGRGRGGTAFEKVSGRAAGPGTPWHTYQNASSCECTMVLGHLQGQDTMDSPALVLLCHTWHLTESSQVCLGRVKSSVPKVLPASVRFSPSVCISHCLSQVQPGGFARPAGVMHQLVTAICPEVHLYPDMRNLPIRLPSLSYRRLYKGLDSGYPYGYAVCTYGCAVCTSVWVCSMHAYTHYLGLCPYG